MRKGVISVQFNWIFVLIVGAIIIGFFIFVMQKQRSVSKTNTEIEIRTKLQAILTTAQQSTKTTYAISTPKVDLAFDCEGVAIGDLQPINLRWAFAPSEIKSRRNRIFITSEEFSMPYKTVNLVYITSPDVRYVFVKDPTAGDDYVKDLYEHKRKPSMPANVTKELVSVPADLEDEDYPVVRFVGRYLSSEVPDNEVKDLIDYANLIEDAEITALMVEHVSGTDAYDYGQLRFYEWDGTGFSFIDESHYIGKPLILGAIYTDDVEAYDCSIKEVLDRLSVMNDIIMKKEAQLKAYVPIQASCGLYYTKTHELDTLKDELAKTNPEPKDIFEASKQIRGYNRLLATKSCPLLY